MKNIIQIFKNDLLRIHKNVIAMIVIMGITVIPTLYAWFNIAASWDPYGNTGNLKVAVASNDEGYKGELLPVNLNLGDDVISELQGNKQLNWVFTDAKDAKKGVQSGKYYAAIVIPEDFSKDMMSLLLQMSYILISPTTSMKKKMPSPRKSHRKVPALSSTRSMKRSLPPYPRQHLRHFSS